MARFCIRSAGVVLGCVIVGGGVVVSASPRFHFMWNWTLADVSIYCQQNGYSFA